MYCSEAPRSVWRKMSPAFGGLPPGRYTAAEDGQEACRSACFSRLAAISGYIGKPSLASRAAAPATSPKLIVP